jgi:hypothetical protein
MSKTNRIKISILKNKDGEPLDNDAAQPQPHNITVCRTMFLWSVMVTRA